MFKSLFFCNFVAHYSLGIILSLTLGVFAEHTSLMKIGVFDSGYGGLTILEKMRLRLPQYDYIYLGDNARTPYGTRSFDIIRQYTWECVNYLFDSGCELVILACNTASAKALRSIQQNELIHRWEEDGSNRKRVLGVIRPTVEALLNDDARHIGVLATPGTIASESYVIEINKLLPTARVTQQPCPMWVPMIEAGEYKTEGARWFIKKYVSDLLDRDPQISSIILGCTHYPIIYRQIRNIVPENIRLIEQGEIVALSLSDYLLRHKGLADCLSQGGTCRYLTTEQPDKFSSSATVFLRQPINAEHARI